MTYEETIEYLYNSVPMFQKVGAVAYKEGLHNTLELDRHFGHPHQNFKTIHIAGTNGKGSCSHTIASILQSAGYKVGLYTSPHLKDFRERIRVNGKCVSKEYVIDFVENERHFFEPLHPSFFELTTAMAFKYFAEQGVDIAVIEVGLGGRLDCTNIITPILSIITNISFDHTQFLGNTLEAIAREKAGIIKEGIPVVVGETTEETLPVFCDTAKQKHSKIYLAEKYKEIISSKALADGGIEYETISLGNIKGELGGIYQEKNTNTILCAVKVLAESGINISEANIKEGIGHVSARAAEPERVPGRVPVLLRPLAVPVVPTASGWGRILPALPVAGAAGTGRRFWRKFRSGGSCCSSAVLIPVPVPGGTAFPAGPRPVLLRQ